MTTTVAKIRKRQRTCQSRNFWRKMRISIVAKVRRKKLKLKHLIPFHRLRRRMP